jgi:hypothetical protein
MAGPRVIAYLGVKTMLMSTVAFACFDESTLDLNWRRSACFEKSCMKTSG